jgi:hypothetical protein
VKYTKSTTSKTSTEFLSPTQTGEAFGVTGRTILYWEADGLIRASLRVGRIVRFDLNNVKEQLAAATEQRSLPCVKQKGENKGSTKNLEDVSGTQQAPTSNLVR